MKTRRSFLLGLGATGIAAVSFLTLPPYQRNVLAQLASGNAGLPLSPPDREAEPWAAHLIRAAEWQVGKTVSYDPAYVGLDYPMGDIPIERGVCTDVIVRAYRGAFNFDLQKAVHQDMRNSFSAYPKTWGLKRPDRNIDHRRVPNLETFLKRKGAKVAISNEPESFKPGDLVTQRLPRNLPHIAIVTARTAANGNPLVVHNIGAGTRIEDRLFEFRIVGHFRFNPLA